MGAAKENAPRGWRAGAGRRNHHERAIAAETLNVAAVVTNASRRAPAPRLSEFGEAALEYAARGWRVLPCRPGQKVPQITGWPGKATTSADAIRQWWMTWPAANVAAATGPESGFFVLDVDDEQSLVALERECGALPALYPQTWTGRGWQAFFQWPDGRTIRNSAGRLGAGLDVRGAGGYAVLPPSVHPSGVRYRWAWDRSPEMLDPAPAPGWLLDLIDPPAPAIPDRASSRPRLEGRLASYAAAAIRAELGAAATAAEGTRNATLNSAAYAIGGFVGADLAPEAWAAQLLLEAAAAAGLSATEARATIRSGLAAGRQRPREVA